MFHRLATRISTGFAGGADEDGQVLVEYALIITLIVVVAVGIITTIGLNVSTLYSKINTNFP